MAFLDPTILTITLKINGLNNQVKDDKSGLKKQTQQYASYKKTTLNI